MSLPEPDQPLVSIIRAEVDRAVDPRFSLLQEEIDRRHQSTLREQDFISAAVREKIADQGEVFKDRFELIQEELDRRFSNLSILLDERAKASESLLAERHVTQIKATDKAFDAQQEAMKTAFSAADKAVQAALAAAKEATVKAEAAADKRFDAVNEFREQQADIISRFLLRAEYEVSHKALAERTDENTARMTAQLSALELRLSKRLDIGEGVSVEQRSALGTAQWGSTYDQFAESSKAQATRAMIAMGISAVMMLVGVVSVILVTFRK